MRAPPRFFSTKANIMKALRAIVRTIDLANELVGKAVSWLTVLMVLNVFLVVILRYAFSIGWVWMQEFYVWIHASVFLLGAGYTLLHDGHVRIDLIYRTASARYKALVNICGGIALGGPLIYVIFERSWPIIVRSWENLEKSAEVGGMPGLFIFKTVIAVFCVLFGLQILALLLRSIEALFGIDERPEFQDREDGDALP